MSCDKCNKLLWEYLAQELTKEDAEFVKEHIQTCAKCKAEAIQLQKIMDSLKSLPEEELPRGYHGELMGKLEQERSVSSFPIQKKVYGKWKQLSLVAAAVLLIVAVGGTQGVLSFKNGQGALMYEIEAEKPQKINQDALEHTLVANEERTSSIEEQAVQVEKEATKGNIQTKIENVASPQENVELIPQDIALDQEQTELQHEEEKLPQVTEADENLEESTRSLDEDVTPQMVRAQTRSNVYTLTNEDSISEVQQQVILTVKDEEGVIESIRSLAISLEGYESGQTEGDSMKVSMPSSNAQKFMDGLKELGEIRNLEVASEKTDSVLFEITIEIE